MNIAIGKKLIVGVGAVALVASTQVQAMATPATQWAISATATSEYDSTYGANQAAGAPNATECDGANIWASLSGTSTESLTLTYATPVIPIAINVYQNGKKGAVSNIEVSSDGTSWTSLYTGDPTQSAFGTCDPTKHYDDVLAVWVSQVATPIKYVRVTVDQSTLGWANIDAVELVSRGSQTIGTVAKTLKAGKSLTLPAKTSGALSVVWTSTTKTVCIIKSGKLVAKKKGVCKISGANAGNSFYTAVSVKKSVSIK